ncbi:MAG: hypothetical protein R2813_12950 [Flavobacteriales bacterium]
MQTIMDNASGVNTVDFVLLPEHNLGIERYNSRVDYHTIVEVSKKIWDHADYNRKINALVDLRGCKVSLSVKEVIRLVAFFAKEPRSIRGRSAIIADTPKSVALSALFQSRILLISKTQVVSTPEAGLAFVGADAGLYAEINSTRTIRVVVAPKPVASV